MKKKFNIILSALFIMFACLFPGIVKAEEIEQPNIYYLCLSTENYAIKNKNQLKYNDETKLYSIENITLTKSNAFYVTNGKGESFYSKSNSEMHVENAQALAYTIYFSKDSTFTASNVETGMYVSDCHITYALYDKGSYTLKLDDSTTTTLAFNPYQKNYDSFEAKNIVLAENQTVSVVEYVEEANEETGEVATKENIISSITASYSGSYHIIYTPRKTVDGKEYGFNEDGKYGSGEDYIYQLYLEIEDEYYIVFKNISYDKGTPVDINGENGYYIERDLEYPNVNKYTTESFLLSDVEEKIEYQLYSKTPSGYQLLNDDEDEDSSVSKLTSTYAGWYKLTLLEAEGKYTSTITIVNKDFGDYYLATKANNYCYDEFGNIELLNEYKFIKLEDDDDDYNKDYDQYRLIINITNEMLNTKMYITNGLDYYKNGSSFIEFNVEGEYEIIFANSHLYGREQNYKFSLKDSSIEYEEVRISSYQDLLNMINACNDNTEYSVNKYFYLTKDITVFSTTPVINAFYGTFDGSYHTIYNIALDTDDEQTNLGFIRVLGKSGIIKKLSIENMKISAKKSSNVGFVGYSYGEIIEVSIKGTVEGLDHVGSIVGYNANYKFDDSDSITDSSKKYGYGLIKLSSANCNVAGEKFVGGIAGFNGGKIYETNSYCVVNNISYKSTKTIEAIGGIAGYSTGVIALSDNYGVIGYKDVGNFVGGIAGLSTGLFYYCNNYANVNGQHYVGGIIGTYGSLKNNESYQEYEEETDLKEHYVTYVINCADVYGSQSVGGIIGWVTETGINLTNAISSGNIEAKNGSRAGGIVGNFQNGNIESCFAEGTIEGSGVNSGLYLGGIAGYSNGKIKYVFSATNIIGNDYLGGICGYMTSTAELISSISNTLFRGSKSSTEHIGGVCGYVDGLPFADAKNEKIKYNYFIGDNIGGIYTYEFGESAYDAAKHITPEHLASKDVVSPYLNINFQGEGFIGGEYEYSYPSLRSFEMYDEDKTFTADYDLKELFAKNANTFKLLETKYSVISIQINYFEWNADNGDLDKKEDYELVKTYRFFYGEELNSNPDFIYASINGSKYMYKTDKGNYFVSWPNNSLVFINQNIYAEYTQIMTTLSYNDFLAEGTFVEGTSFTVKEIGNNLVVEFFLNGKEIKVDSYTLKVKKTPDRKYLVHIEDSNNEFEPQEYGDYLVIPVTNGSQRIIINSSPLRLPTWSIVLISASSTLVITLLCFLIITKKKNKKNNKKEENPVTEATE